MYRTITERAAMIILAVAVFTGATSATMANGEDLVPVGFYTGVEAAQGTNDVAGETCYGNTFVLNSSGEWETHHLTISLNYLNVPNQNGSGFGVTGGTWSLVMYEKGSYTGTLYGTISVGSVLLTANSAGAPAKRVNLDLLATGGLGAMAGKEKEISGVYQAETNMRTHETSGSAAFSF